MMDRLLVQRLSLGVRGEQGLRAGQKAERHRGAAHARALAQPVQRLSSDSMISGPHCRFNQIGQHPGTSKERVIRIDKERVVQRCLVATETQLEKHEFVVSEGDAAVVSACNGVAQLCCGAPGAWGLPAAPWGGGGSG